LLFNSTIFHFILISTQCLQFLMLSNEAASKPATEGAFLGTQMPFVGVVLSPHLRICIPQHKNHNRRLCARPSCTPAAVMCAHASEAHRGPVPCRGQHVCICTCDDYRCRSARGHVMVMFQQRPW